MRLLVTAAILCCAVPAAVQAQCTGQFAAGAICGNPAAGQDIPLPALPNALGIVAYLPSGMFIPNVPFGGDWLSYYTPVSFVDNAPHAGNAKTAFSASTYAVGSTADGPANANYGAFIVAQKQNYLTSAILGEIDGIYVVANQGKLGDTAAILAGTRKTNGGTGAAIGAEIAADLVDSSGVVQQANHQHIGLMSVDSSEYVGYNTEAWVGNLTSAFRADTYTGVGASPAWSNVLVARANRTDANIYFKIDGAGKVYASPGSAALPAYAFVGGTGDGMWHPGAGGLGWATNGVNRMYLDPGKLYPDIDNTYSLGDASFRWANVYTNQLRANTLSVITMANAATTSAVCYNTGTGLFTYNGTVGTCTVSDARLKDVDGPITGALDKLLQISGVNFHFKDQRKYGPGPQIGVVAQAVEAVFPQLVSTDEDGTKSADYQKLVAPIIEAIRELKVANDSLRAEVDQLRRRLNMPRAPRGPGELLQ